jgi:hypothetical protein
VEEVNQEDCLNPLAQKNRMTLEQIMVEAIGKTYLMTDKNNISKHFIERQT